MILIDMYISVECIDVLIFVHILHLFYGIFISFIFNLFLNYDYIPSFNFITSCVLGNERAVIKK